MADLDFPNSCIESQVMTIHRAVVMRAGPGASVAVLSFVALLASACSPTAPSSSSTCRSNGSLSAQIDGVVWAAPCVLAVHNVDFRYIEVFGSSRDDTQRMTFRLYATEVGTYLLGGPEPAPVGMGSSAGLNIGCQPHPGPCPSWGVAPCCGQPNGNGSGTIVLTELTGKRASGTFSLNLVGNGSTGATASKVVTNGRFDVTF